LEKKILARNFASIDGGERDGGGVTCSAHQFRGAANVGLANEQIQVTVAAFIAGSPYACTASTGPYDQGGDTSEAKRSKMRNSSASARKVKKFCARGAQQATA